MSVAPVFAADIGVYKCMLCKKIKKYNFLVISTLTIYNMAVLWGISRKELEMNVNLVLNKKNGTRKSFHLPSTVTVIGRRQECDLCIPLMVVSRRHCQVNMDEGRLRIRDLGSRNGTFLNGQRIEEAEIQPGDTMSIGPLNFMLQINGEPADIGSGDSAILQPPEHLINEQREAAEHAEKISYKKKEADMHQSYGATEILNGISEEE